MIRSSLTPTPTLPNLSTWTFYERELAEMMAAAGIDPALIYASAKTGLLVTEENRDKVPVEALEEWEAALHEYEELTKGEPS